MTTDLAQRVQRGADIATGRETAAPTARQQVERMAPRFADALPKHIDADRFLAQAKTCLSTVPKIEECDTRSILGALMQAATLGLMPNDGQGLAYIIVRWNKNRDGKDRGGNEATFQVGYKGYIHLGDRAGITVDAHVVRDGDTFDPSLGTSPSIVHKPTWNGGEIVGYYATATMRNGRTVFELLSKAEAERHRDRFASTKTRDGRIYGPWHDDFDAMALKTAIRLLAKRIPGSVDLLGAAVAADERVVTLDAESRPVPQQTPIDPPAQMAIGGVVDAARAPTVGEGGVREPEPDEEVPTGEIVEPRPPSTPAEPSSEAKEAAATTPAPKGAIGAKAGQGIHRDLAGFGIPSQVHPGIIRAGCALANLPDAGFTTKASHLVREQVPHVMAAAERWSKLDADEQVTTAARATAGLDEEQTKALLSWLDKQNGAEA